MSLSLLAWVGRADLSATESSTQLDGPIARALDALTFERVFLLNGFPDEGPVAQLAERLARTFATRVDVQSVTLSSPTDYGEIYEAASALCARVRDQLGWASGLAFHLSPGTPAMAAVWVLLGKTQYPATFIQTSPEKGLQIVEMPFELSVEYTPTLRQQRDSTLRARSAESPPLAAGFEHITARSPQMLRAIDRARRAAPRNVPVLLEGESGTGKELFARAIHDASPRYAGPFVVVNCGAIPGELVESELFGHRKGAFTGATEARAGYFESAHDGTLFLDELGELPLDAQVKLLRVLQESEVVRVGETRARRINVRVVAATNRSLANEAAAGRFREDLFYRLAVAVIRLPPLRERQGDVSLLLDTVLNELNLESMAEPGFVAHTLSPGARQVLLAHDWPGNVRELRNTLRRLVLWSDAPRIERRDAEDAVLRPPAPADGAILGRPIHSGVDLRELIAEVCRHYLSRAMVESGGNKTQAARSLGLGSHQTLTQWLRKYRVTD